jgi:hypothetical protein
MRPLQLAMALVLLAGAAHADEAATQRALVERDQQSAEFAAGARRIELETLHQKQLLELLVSPQPADYLRRRMAQEREVVVQRPLPLPGRPAGSLDPIPLKGFGG